MYRVNPHHWPARQTLVACLHGLHHVARAKGATISHTAYYI